jgi:1,2-diacylglycerol 3-beta-glucosyltransferase
MAVIDVAGASRRSPPMRTRVLAASLLAISAFIALLAVASMLVARILQLAIAGSMVYVAWLGWRGGRVMRRALVAPPQGPLPDPLPRLSVVVAARDEAAVIDRVVIDLLAQEYRSDGETRFAVLVLDDGSVDGTGPRAARLAAGEPGVVRVVRREAEPSARTKGGALAFAAPHLSGEVVVAVDADARIAPDFLARAMRAWQRDPAAAALQVQRRASNADRSWFTAAQDEEQLMDMASQCGRWATDGTAELRGNGMFVRRAALEAAGGWSSTALTEDLDLSTRLGVVGEHVTLAPEVVVEEEAVTRLAELWHQRMRWAEGSLRRIIDHGPRLLLGPLPLDRKLDFLSFAGEFAIPPLFVASIVISVLTALLPVRADWTVPLSLFVGYGLGTFLLAAAGLSAHGIGGWRLLGRSLRGSLFLSHWLLVVPVALAKIAFLPRTRHFRKTPRMAR